MIIKIKVPSPGESINEVEIASWLKQDGEYVEKDQEICEIESEKVSLTVYAEESGTLHIQIPEGETVQVGSVIAEINTEQKSSVPAETKEKAEAEKTEEKREQTAAVSQNKVEDKPVSAKNRKTTAEPAERKKAVPVTLSPRTNAGLDASNRGISRKKMSQLRRKVAERLVSVKNETAMLTTFNEVDMAAVMEIRKKYKESFKKAFDVNLGFMSFFTRAVTIALKDYPAVNAQIDGSEIIYHDYADIGIAVSTPKGLMVPVIRNAELLSFADIEKTISSLAQKAREGKITLDDMTGGTFTITNGGIFGSMLSTPIINPPQCGILGMHNIVQRPVAINGEVVIRPVMYLALSYDHRVIDGRESVGFLVRVKELIEAPEKMLLGIPPITN
jgi:2-oxoglutarate dehydrogenase E2 component (dihydrolipoamide succinyltransferase)